MWDLLGLRSFEVDTITDDYGRGMKYLCGYVSDK